MYSMTIDTGPKFHSVPSSPPVCDPNVKATDLEFLDNIFSLDHDTDQGHILKDFVQIINTVPTFC